MASIIDWMTMSRWDWAVWGWSHPWSLAAGPAIVGAAFLITYIRNR